MKSIPQQLDELKALNQWVNYVRIWNTSKNAGRGGYDKPPINPATLRDGMTNNPASWSDYETAAANIGKTAKHRDLKHKDTSGKVPTVEATVEGAGLILANGYCGVDLDNVIDDEGNLAPFASKILKELDTYAEVSPSGHGLHLLLFCGDLLEEAKAAEKAKYSEEVKAGKNPEEAKARAKGAGDFGKQFTLDAAGAITDEAGKAYELEIYFYIRGGRYFTVTGNSFNNKSINHNKDAKLKEIFNEYIEKTKAYAESIRPATAKEKKTYTTQKPATGENDRKMLESALAAIDPSALDFGEWASAMTALKSLGYTLAEAEDFSSGALNGSLNPKNDSNTNARRWDKFHFAKGDENAAGIIINLAKRFSWNAADAFSEKARAEYGRSLYSKEARTEYGRSLHTEEERRQYGRDQHKDDWKADFEDEVEEGAAAEMSDEEIEAFLAGQDPEKSKEPTAAESEPEKEASLSVGSLTEEPDDRRDPKHEPARLTLEEWTKNNYYAVTFSVDPGDASKAESLTVIGYSEYLRGRKYIHANGYYITYEDFQTEAKYYPGLLTYESALEEFKTTDDRFLELKHFPEFSKTAKIHLHDRLILAADTGVGKSSLAINFLNDLNDDYPVLYFNLEMNRITILRRLVAIRTGLLLDQIEGYQKDPNTEAAVNKALKALTSRKPLQIREDVYTLEDMEDAIKQATADRTEPTIVFIDHSLLVKCKDPKLNSDRYSRFTTISENLTRIARENHVILFILLQQSREGKKEEAKPPKNSSLKESGSWENDATHIIFLWYDSKAKKKKLLITKNRNGDQGAFDLNYYAKTQTYTEEKSEKPTKSEPTAKQEAAEKLHAAYLKAITKTGGEVTLGELAEALETKIDTVRATLLDYAGKKCGFIEVNNKLTFSASEFEAIKETDVIRFRPYDPADDFRQADESGSNPGNKTEGPKKSPKLI